MNQENQLIEFNVTDSAIAELKEKYLPLVINGIEDKNGYKAVKSARMIVKTHRVDVDKRRKELTADALEWQRKINAEAKRITLLLEPIEEHLQSEEKRIDDEIEAIKIAKQKAEMQKLQERIDMLNGLDFKFNFSENKYTNSYSSMEISALHLKNIDDVLFIDFYDSAKKLYDVERDRALEELRLINERKAKEETERKAAYEKQQAELAEQRKQQAIEAEKIKEDNRIIAEEKIRLENIAKDQLKKELEIKLVQEKIASEKQLQEEIKHIELEIGQQVKKEIESKKQNKFLNLEEELAYEAGFHFARQAVNKILDRFIDEKEHEDLIIEIKNAINLYLDN